MCFNFSRTKTTFFVYFKIENTEANICCALQYATWDLAFHMIPMADVDLEFTKQQLLLFLSERYMHPKGQVLCTRIVLLLCPYRVLAVSL